MSDNFALLPAFFDEMVRGDQCIMRMAGGFGREKKKDKNEKAREDIIMDNKGEQIKNHRCQDLLDGPIQNENP